MEVFFLDVAQGTSQVILLGDRRAIVIDCGFSHDRFVLQFLQRMGITEIECLIVSHSHNDHIGGATSVLGEYQDRISRICFVQDHEFLDSKFWKRISELIRGKKLSKDSLVRLEATDQPQELWSNEARSIRLKTYSPAAVENLLAQQSETPNPTSAVLFLDVDEQRIVFAADSEVDQWREIYRKSGKEVKCDLLAVPHHAGRAHQSEEDLDWLFGNALKADVAIISVGTSNTHGHPRRDVIQALTRHGTKVLCTQITRLCNAGKRDLEFLRPGVLHPQLLMGRSSSKKDLTNAGHSRNVACAGTIRVEATDDGLVVDRLSEHQQAVDRFSKSGTGCPICRL